MCIIVAKDKTTKFELFKSDYDNMLFMAVKISKDEFEKVIPTQKIKKSMLEEYKTFFKEHGIHFVPTNELAIKSDSILEFYKSWVLS